MEYSRLLKLIKCMMCDRTGNCIIEMYPRVITYSQTVLRDSTYPVHKILCQSCGNKTNISPYNIGDEMYGIIKVERTQMLRLLEEYDFLLLSYGMTK